jgi:hypothetical protein
MGSAAFLLPVGTDDAVQRLAAVDDELGHSWGSGSLGWARAPALAGVAASLGRRARAGAKDRAHRAAPRLTPLPRVG